MIRFNLIQPNDDREKRGENAGKVLLNAENLRKSYGKGEARVDALADVSLQIYEGDRSLITLTPDHIFYNAIRDIAERLHINP